MAKDYKQLDGIKQCMNDNLIGAYNKGYKQGQDDAYKCWSTGYNEGCEQGRKEAWECAKKIVCMFAWPALEDMFSSSDFNTIFYIYSASEAINKIHNYANNRTNQHEINLGDEVEIGCSNKRYIVMDTTNIDQNIVSVVSATGHSIITFVDRCKKTGKCYPEFIEMLNKLRDNVEDE